MRSKFPSAILIAILLLTSVVLVSPIASADPSTAPISIDGDVDLHDQAVLNGWLGDGTASSPYIIANLTIDAGGQESAISINNTDAYLTIENCTLSNAYKGVNITYAANVTVDRNRISVDNGAFLVNSNNITVANNTIVGPAGCGVVLMGYGHNNTIFNNTIADPDIYGIFAIVPASGSYENAVTNNTITNPGSGGIVFYSDNGLVANNTITGSGGFGALVCSANSTLVNNKVNYDPAQDFNLEAYGILLLGSHNNSLINNTITDSHTGIYLDGSSNNTIADNTFRHAWESGILANDSCNNTIFNNSCTGAWDGIEIYDSMNNVISNNTITDSIIHGVHVEESNNNTLANNTITDLDGAFYLCNASNNTVTDNTITNVYMGIEIERSADLDQGYSSENNVVSNNMIADADNGICIYDSRHSTITNNTIGRAADADEQGRYNGIFLDSSDAYLDGNRLTNCSVVLMFAGLGPFIDVQSYIDGMTITPTNTVNGDPVYFLKNVDMNNASVPSNVGEVILLNVTHFNVNGLDLNYGGVIAGFSSHITIVENVFTRSYNGATLYASDNCTVSGNQIIDPMWGGIGVERSNNITVEGNTILSAGAVGINIGSLTGGFPTDAMYASGVPLPLATTDNVVRNNIIVEPGFAGICVDSHSTGNTMADNTITGAFYGIYARGSGDLIVNNTITAATEDGIYLEWGAQNNRITNNTISDAQRGIIVDGSTNNVLTGNRINGSSSYGIKLIDNNGTNLIYANLLVGNNGATSTYDAEHAQAYDDSDNQWISDGVGNYWSDWQSPDANHDGIVDVSYLLAGDADGRDTLPMVLMYVHISSPLSHTNRSTIVVSGTAGAFSPYEVSWTNEATGASGICTGTAAWSANIALVEGSNRIIVTLTDSNGNRTSDEMLVTYDPVAPTIRAHSPIGNGVAVDTVIVITFSEAMNTGSVSIVIDGVSGTISWNGNVATFTPASPLAYATEYAITVSGQDLAGNVVSDEWSFKTSTLGSITGTVRDAGGKALAYAKVTLSNGLTTTTDADGKFVFEDVVAGDYSMTVSKDGYAPMTQDVSAAAGENHDIGTLAVGATAINSSSNDLLIAGAAFAVIAALLAAAFVLMRRKST
jgi:parallel beta-helix repeat protein